MRNASTKTFSQKMMNQSITNKDDFSAKTVKTGEILNLINGVKKLEQRQIELSKLKSKLGKKDENSETNRWEQLMLQIQQ